MTFSERREARVPVALYAELVVGDQITSAFVTSVSEHGLLLDAVSVPSRQTAATVQVQLSLPGEPDALWIAGQIVHDDTGAIFCETAIRFEVMADGHWQSLRRWLRVRAMLLQAQSISLPAAA